MRTFRDNAGRTWTLAVNVAALRRVRSLCDVNLVTRNPAQVIEDVITDPVTLCNVLYAIVQPQALALAVTDEQFGDAMAGDVIDAAARALMEELADFTPNPRDRARVQKVTAAMLRAAEQSQGAADERTEKIATAILLAAAAEQTAAGQRVEQALTALTSGPTSGGSPALPGLTPAG
jgi:hypothetical protein